MMHGRSTPTPSECEEDYDLRTEAWFFWVAVQFKQVSKNGIEPRPSDLIAVYLFAKTGLFELQLGFYESGPYE